MTPHRVFDGDLLRADLFNAQAPRLFVTFRQRVDDAGLFSGANPVKSFVRHGFAHLHLQSKYNDWYINDETDALDAALAALGKSYHGSLAMGFPMGGYAALRFAKALGVRDVMLISAQVSIHPDVVPWDRRYREDAGAFDRTRGDLGLHGDQSLRGLTIYDPFRPKDRRNARAIHDLFPSVLPCRFVGGGHPATQVLRMMAGLGGLQTGLRKGALTRKRAVDLHRSVRSGSPLYWRRLAKAAVAHNKNELAEFARAREAELQSASKG